MFLRFSDLLKIQFVFLFLLSAFISTGQQLSEQYFIEKYESSKVISDKVLSLKDLSDYYYTIKNFEKGDSLIEKLIIEAEASMNTDLMLLAYFENPGYNSSGISTIERSATTKEYINRALEFAKEKNLTPYIALAYSNMAALNNTNGSIDKAFKNASLGFTTALNTTNDSAKIICAIELGNIYLKRSDVLTAFKTYTNALNIGVAYKNESLLPPVFHAMADLYKRLNKYELAKSYINRSRSINEKQNNNSGLINDYIFLAKLSNYTAAKQHLQNAIRLAESSQNFPLKIEAEKVLFFYILLSEKPAIVFAYLASHPELKDLFTNTGPDYLNWMKAEIYFYGGQPDSAIIYFRKAENSFNEGYDLASKKGFFGEFALCLRDVKNIPEAISYNLKSMDIARTASDLNTLMANSKELKTLYQQQGQFAEALNFDNLYDSYKDSVDLLGKEKDLVILEIENETKEQQRQQELADAALQRKYNLQYMLITIVVISAFIIMIMIGMFKVSAFTIRLMGFLSLIFFFEFIILYLDQKIHDMTHGEPWKIWLIKIVIISFLLPLHHFLEHKLIRYLLSRHLIKIRSRISLSKFLKKKKPLPDVEKQEEA
ncbi:MAG: hypothetical protein ABIP79_12110 [Chitinophagaceae bacterium]